MGRWTYGGKRSRALSDEKDEAEEKVGSLRRRYHERTRQTQTTTSRQWLDRDFGPRGELLVMAGQGGEKGGKRENSRCCLFFFFFLALSSRPADNLFHLIICVFKTPLSPRRIYLVSFLSLSFFCPFLRFSACSMVINVHYTFQRQHRVQTNVASRQIVSPSDCEMKP